MIVDLVSGTDWLIAAQSAEVTNIGQRTLLTLLMIAIIGLSFLGMRKGWRNRAKLELAEVNKEKPENVSAISPSVDARFAGTTIAGKWLDRITGQGLGTPRSVTLQIFNEGIFVTDEGDFNLWIDKSAITSVDSKRGIAGDVVEKVGMLIFTWQLGELQLDSGIRVNRHADHELIVKALQNFPRAANFTELEMGAGA